MSPVKLTARVARTAHDLTHANRLRVPEFGVVRISVVAGAKGSKPYRPEGSPTPKEADKGTDDFHFAPEKEAGVEIRYEIDDPGAHVDEAKIELFCRFEANPLWTLDLTKLGADWYAHGTHVVKWDGRVVTPTAEQAATRKGGGFEHDLTAIAADTKLPPFPDGYVNLCHTTYKLRLTVSGAGLPGKATVSWTYFHVLAEKLVLEYGPKEVLPAPVAGKGDHRAVLADLEAQGAKPPAETAASPVKVRLDSDVYKRSAAQMFDNTLYTTFETLWGDGPMIPIFAKVTILKSDDTGVDAPKAIGNVRFLWDWESKSKAIATGRHGDAFVNDAQDCHKDTTKPKGQNCHQLRGGKRGPGGSPVFPAQAGYDPADALTDGSFPFKVEAVTEKRKWAAYSYAWRGKKLAGKTGIVFQPARTAGDAYVVSVHLAWDLDKDGKVRIDVDTDAPIKVAGPKRTKAATGQFQVWRRTHLRKYLKKRAAGVPALTVATILGNYTDAFMEVADATGGASTVAKATWNAAITTATSGWGVVDKLVLDPATDQYDAGPEGMTFRTRAAFSTAWKKHEIEQRLLGIGVTGPKATPIANAAGAAASAAGAETAARTSALAQGYNATDSDTIKATAGAGWTYVDTYLANAANNLETDSKYAKWLEGKAVEVLKSLFDGQFAAGDGVTIFQTERSHNLTGLQTTGILLGLAHDFANATLNRCGFLLMSRSADVSCGNEKVSAHEIGHHFFLPHPVDTAETTEYSAHDKVVPSKCLMSYNFALEMNLCGFCQLRLRGWDKSALDTDGPKNKKA